MIDIEQMTFPLWGMAIFMGWIIAIAVLLIIVRIRHLSAGGAVQDFGLQDDKSLHWRLFRVHANLVENLPLYLGVVFLLTVRNSSGLAINLLIVAYIASRLIHSMIHIAGANPIFRVFSLGIQFSCLIALTALAIV
jgi:uncharacterized MAPEG superfamily protein